MEIKPNIYKGFCGDLRLFFDPDIFRLYLDQAKENELLAYVPKQARLQIEKNFEKVDKFINIQKKLGQANFYKKLIKLDPLVKNRIKSHFNRTA